MCRNPNYSSTNSLCKYVKMCFSQISRVLSTAYHPNRLYSDFCDSRESQGSAICPQSQNLTAVSMYSLSRSWHYQELFNCRSAVNMFTTLFSVSRETGPALRLQSNVEPLKKKGQCCAEPPGSFLWAVSSSEQTENSAPPDGKRARKSQSKPAVIIRGLLAHQTSR